MELTYRKRPHESFYFFDRKTSINNQIFSLLPPRSSAFVMQKWRTWAFVIRKRAIAAAWLMENSWFIYGNSCLLCLAFQLLPFHFQLFQLHFHHCFNKLFTPFLVVVIDIATKHNLFFPTGYRKVCCFSTFAIWKTENCGCRYDGFYFFSPKHLRCKQKSSYLCCVNLRIGYPGKFPARGKPLSTLPI